MTGEAHNRGRGQGAVVVDIGDDDGVLVLRAPAELAGAEIEISPAGDDGRRSHVAVLPRQVASGVVHAAVYGPLPAGVYHLWHRDGATVALTVEIIGGAVVEATWPS